MVKAFSSSVSSATVSETLTEDYYSIYHLNQLHFNHNQSIVSLSFFYCTESIGTRVNSSVIESLYVKSAAFGIRQ